MVVGEGYVCKIRNCALKTINCKKNWVEQRFVHKYKDFLAKENKASPIEYFIYAVLIVYNSLYKNN